MAAEVAGEFEQLFTGRLWSLLSWQQLTDFWARIDRGAGWYLYAVGEPLPTAPATAQEAERFIAETDAPPVGLERPGPLPESRKRWWRSLFGS